MGGGLLSHLGISRLAAVLQLSQKVGISIVVVFTVAFYLDISIESGVSLGTSVVTWGASTSSTVLQIWISVVAVFENLLFFVILVARVITHWGSLDGAIFHVVIILLGVLEYNFSFFVTTDRTCFQVLSSLVFTALDVVSQSTQIFLVIAVGLLIVTVSSIMSSLVSYPLVLGSRGFGVLISSTLESLLMSGGGVPLDGIIDFIKVIIIVFNIDVVESFD